jgi:hypothetical protein
MGNDSSRILSEFWKVFRAADTSPSWAWREPLIPIPVNVEVKTLIWINSSLPPFPFPRKGRSCTIRFSKAKGQKVLQLAVRELGNHPVAAGVNESRLALVFDQRLLSPKTTQH